MWHSMWLLSALFVVGCSGSEESNEVGTRDEEPRKPESKNSSSAELKEARRQILKQLPEAAGISYADFRILANTATAPRVTSLENQPLSLVFLSLRPNSTDVAQKDLDAEYNHGDVIPKPKELTDAMQGTVSKGYYTYLQPEGLADLTCNLEGGKALGEVSYQLGNIVKGRVHYVAQKENDDWKITEFHLPAWGAHTVLKKSGTWKASGVGLFPKVSLRQPTADFLLKRSAELYRVPIFLGTTYDENYRRSGLGFVYQNQKVTKEELGAQLKGLIQSKIAQDKTPALIIHADRDLPVSYIRDVFKLAHEAGFPEARLTADANWENEKFPNWLGSNWGELPISLRPQGGDDPNSESSQILELHLKANPRGSLANINFRFVPLGNTDRAFEELKRQIQASVGYQKGRGRLMADSIVELQSDPHLTYENLIQAISVCAGEFDSENNQPIHYVDRIRLFGIGIPKVEIVDLPLEEIQPIPLEDLNDLSVPNLTVEPIPLPIVGKPNVPKGAVTKGSFTVWTVPKDPKPGEKYNIMIQIKLPNTIKLTQFPKSDVKGNIVGTDGYQDFFGGITEAGFIIVKEGKVLLDPIVVPGAQKLVKDIITVESRLLKEKQTLELVF